MTLSKIFFLLSSLMSLSVQNREGERSLVKVVPSFSKDRGQTHEDKFDEDGESGNHFCFLKKTVVLWTENSTFGT